MRRPRMKLPLPLLKLYLYRLRKKATAEQRILLDKVLADRDLLEAMQELISNHVFPAPSDRNFESIRSWLESLLYWLKENPQHIWTLLQLLFLFLDEEPATCSETPEPPSQPS